MARGSWMPWRTRFVTLRERYCDQEGNFLSVDAQATSRGCTYTYHQPILTQYCVCRSRESSHYMLCLRKCISLLCFHAHLCFYTNTNNFTNISSFFSFQPENLQKTWLREFYQVCDTLSILICDDVSPTSIGLLLTGTSPADLMKLDMASLLLLKWETPA